MLLKWLGHIRLAFFERSFSNIEKRQQRVLERIIASSKETVFFHQKCITNKEQFADRMPLQNYADFQLFLEKDYQNYSKAIVPSKPSRWEKTSGSSGVAKKIAYTPLVILNLIDYLFIWFADVLINGPQLKSKRIFYSLSAPTGKDGDFEDDLDYLPNFISKRLEKYIVNPRGLNSVKDPHQFKLRLVKALLEARDLEIIFIWSPSYLISLMEFIKSNKEEIKGLIKTEVPGLDGMDTKLIWPELKLISCWTDASASLFINEIELLFPDTVIQGKGLISTESILSIPLFGTEGGLPLVDKVYYEFVNEEGEILGLHEIKYGQEYELVVTTTNGLYRYLMGDKLKVVGFRNEAPVLKFMGRKGRFVDLTGEKFSEEIASDVVSSVLGIKGFFIPSLIESLPYYTFVTDEEDEELAELIEKELCKTFHYEQSRFLGQLGPVRVKSVESVQKFYSDFYIDKGMIEGNIKFSFLVTDLEDAHQILDRL